MIPFGDARRRGQAFTAVLAAAVLYAGVHWGSTTAGGADSYGYVSQAGLWRTGHLSIQQDVVRPSPWPDAADTWAPLGYRASPHQRDAIVPVYAPGLPMLMALAQTAGGFCAAFLVVPLCGALTIWLTGVLGRRLFDRSSIAAASAVLVATSPIFVYQLMNPMTDVPATAAWLLALVSAAAGWPVAAGFASGAAILIRPNLAVVAAAIAGWLFLTRAHPWRYLFATAPAVVAVGVVNWTLYESPLISGYGTLGELYSPGHVAANARQFATWLLETQTPAVLLPLLYFAAPRLWPAERVRHARLLLGGVAAAVVVPYLFYTPFDAWWYLRFLLPVWPLMMVLTAAALDGVLRAPIRRGRGAALMACALGLGAYGIREAAARHAFEVGRSERRYIDVARFVSGATEPSAVIVALQHSGTLRMYAGRLTLRFDQLDPGWLDRTVEFLQAAGRHPFIVLEGGEHQLFRDRFGGASDVGRLSWKPYARLDGADVSIYDPIDRGVREEPLAIAAGASRRTGWRCDPPQDSTAARGSGTR